MVVLLSFTYTLGGYIFYPTGLFYAKPKYQCKNLMNSYSLCKESVACSRSADEWQIDPYSIKNIDYYFLRCLDSADKKEMIASIGTSFNLFSVVGVILIRYWTKVAGRKTIISYSLLASIVCLICMYISTNFYLYLGFYCCFGLFSTCLIVGSYLTMLEIVPNSMKFLAISFMSVIDAMDAAAASFFFYYVSKDIRMFLLLLILSYSIILLCIDWVMVESPAYYMDKGENDLAIGSFNYISFVNGRSSFTNDIVLYNNVHESQSYEQEKLDRLEKYRGSNFWHQFNNIRNSKKTFFFLVIWFLTYHTFFFVTMFEYKLDYSIYSILEIDSFSSVGSIAISICISYFCSTSSNILVSYMALVLSGCCFFNDWWTAGLYLMFYSTASTQSLLQIYTEESNPSTIGQIYPILYLFGKLSGLVAPLLAESIDTVYTILLFSGFICMWCVYEIEYTIKSESIKITKSIVESEMVEIYSPKVPLEK